MQPTIFEVVKKETPDIAQEFGNVDVDSLIEAPNEAMVNKSRSERKKRELYSTMKTKLKTVETDQMDPETIKKKTS